MKPQKLLALILALLMVLSLAACGSAANTGGDTQQPDTTAPDTQTPRPDAPEPKSTEKAELSLFIAASLEEAFIELIADYTAGHPNVTLTYNADSSGKLLTQIQEGFTCDIFFSAGKSQVDTLERDGLLVAGTRTDLLYNKEVIISAKDSGTAVTGIENIKEAKSIALAAESVPAGQYARKAFIAAGYLEPADDVKTITTAQVAEALGVEISECSNASQVREAVKEGACEIGFVYYSDAYSVKDYVDFIQMLDTDLTGKIVYPVARVVNPEATDAVNAAADAFLQYLQSDEALAVFEKYMFLTSDAG